MRTVALALAASSLLGSVVAGPHERHQHQHQAFHKRGDYGSPAAYPSPSPSAEPEHCGCKTYTTTFKGKGTLVQNNAKAAKTKTVVSTSKYTPVHPVPSPYETTYANTGTYTIKPSTVTLTSTEYVPYPTKTVLTKGEHTYGGITTTVKASTVITCPYAYKTTENDVEYSTVTHTTYTCPSAGEYTIGPYTTTVSDVYTAEYPTVTYYNPGTYSAPEKTVTVTDTKEAYTCPYETVEPTYKAKPTKDSIPESYGEIKKAKNPKPTTYKAPKTHKPKKHHSKPAHTKAHASGHKKNKHITTNGNQWAMTYTPYDNSGGCKSHSQVAADIAKISAKGFTTLRLYSTDCDTLEAVGSACETHQLRLILGIFIDQDGISGGHEQLADITAWGKYDLVDMVVVGNEAIFNSYTTAGELAGFIKEVRTKLHGAGCTVPITTTEPLNILQEVGSQLCDSIDVIGSNLQAYFNSQCEPAHAGQFVADQLELVAKICPGKDAYNFESGWPSGGGANGAATASKAAQKLAIESIVEKAGDKSCIFSFEDDLWKDGGYNGVEQHFGCLDVFP